MHLEMLSLCESADYQNGTVTLTRAGLEIFEGSVPANIRAVVACWLRAEADDLGETYELTLTVSRIPSGEVLVSTPATFTFHSEADPDFMPHWFQAIELILLSLAVGIYECELTVSGSGTLGTLRFFVKP